MYYLLIAYVVDLLKMAIISLKLSFPILDNVM